MGRSRWCWETKAGNSPLGTTAPGFLHLGTATKKNTSRSGHHFPGASRQERERRAGGCERGAMPAQPGAASCQQPPAVPTISVLCGTCEKALPFLSHAAAAAAAGPLGPEWTEPRGHRRGSQMCAGWLGVYWHTVRLIRIGPGWHCSIN